MSSASDPQPESVSALSGVTRHRDNPFTRSKPALIGFAFLVLMFAACLGSLPWTLTAADSSVSSVPRYDAGDPKAGRLPPSWWSYDDTDRARAIAAMDPNDLGVIADQHDVPVDAIIEGTHQEAVDEALNQAPAFILGSDMLGRSLAIRLLTGGGISLTIGICAALISVGIGTIYGAVAAYMGGKVDSIMMRTVDVLYGLPYILLVVLLAVASNALLDEYQSRSRTKTNWSINQIVQTQTSESGDPLTKSQARILFETDPVLQDELMVQAAQIYPRRVFSAGTRTTLDVLTLLIAIGGVSWLTMARVIRGQVLSLKSQPFIEAARALGSPGHRVFVKHLLPNLIGPIVVYTTLAVPQAILQESFLSFLGIGVKPPLPSWGNLAAEGLSELNTYRSHWWLLFFPCALLGLTLLAMNFVGEGLREAFDPKRSR
ncbi:MAG: ABC transporter permease [Phycisphaerales bacterium]|nr:ABC transporter permease [Phycisphaerales bacterium]